MSQYHIELRTQERVWEALVVDAKSIGSLRIEVAAFVGELLKDHAAQIWVDKDWRVDVTDETGLILFVMHLFVTDSSALVAPSR